MSNNAHIPEVRKANKSQTAEFFDVSLPTVESWIRKGCPVQERGSRGVSWVLDLRAVAQWLYEGAASTGVMDPDKLPPQDRKAWFESEKRKRDLDIEAGELCARPEVERAVATAFAAIAQDLQAIPDQLERMHGISPEVAGMVDVALCGALDSLTDRLSKLAPIEHEQPLEDLA